MNYSHKQPIVDSKQINLSNHQREIVSSVKLDKYCLDKVSRDKIINLICDYADVFAGSQNKLGHYDNIKHEIKLTSDVLIRTRLYRQSPVVRESIRKQVQEMLQDGIIRESK